MSWFNPSPDEAAEAFSYYKNRYYEAASQRSAYARQAQDCASQKSAAISQKNNASTQKLNFEKRLEGITKIIGMLEGTGGWFSTDVPAAISKASSSIKKADDSYKKSIKMTGGVAAASLESAFEVKTVEADSRSSSALQDYKNEKVRLEQSIAELKNQIAALSSQISSLNSQIRTCNAQQQALRNTMNSSAYEMYHYQKYMY